MIDQVIGCDVTIDDAAYDGLKKAWTVRAMTVHPAASWQVAPVLREAVEADEPIIVEAGK